MTYMRCDFCGEPASSMVGDQNHILVCDTHAAKPLQQTDWSAMERKVVLPATGNGQKSHDTYDTFLQVTGGGGNLDNSVREVHLCIYNNAGDMFAQSWFKLDDLEATLARVYMGDLDPDFKS
jgi:hypothetical protein